jgi:hypothetical protein
MMPEAPGGPRYDVIEKWENPECFFLQEIDSRGVRVYFKIQSIKAWWYRKFSGRRRTVLMGENKKHYKYK